MKRNILTLMACVCASLLMAQQATDVTSRLSNANFANDTNGWTTYVKNKASYTQKWSVLNTTQPVAVETYAGISNWELEAYSLKQQVTLQPGTYRLTGQALYRWGSSYNSDVNNTDGKGARSMAWLVAGKDSVPVMRLGDVKMPQLRPAGYANSMYEAAAAFAAGLYKNSITFTIDSQQSVSLGYYGKFDRAQSWFICGPFKLELLPDGTLEAEAAKAISDARTAYAQRKTLYAAKVAAHTSAYTFDTAKADALLAEATTLEAIGTATDELSRAFGQFLSGCYERVELTDLIRNPGFEAGTLDGWDCLHYGEQMLAARTNNGIYAYSGTEGQYLFNTWYNGDGTDINHFLFQTLEHLPQGTYQLMAVLASNQSSATLALRANDQTQAVTCADKAVGVEGTLNFSLKAPAGVRIGVASNRWFKADDFRLYYSNEIIELRDEMKALIDSYELIANQATPGQTLDTYHATIQAIQAEVLTLHTKAETAPYKQQAREAILALIENTPARVGLYDVTPLLVNPSVEGNALGWATSVSLAYGYNVAELFNSTAAFSLSQTLDNMPVGTYQLAMQGFQRTTSFTEGLNAYQNGTAKVKASLKLANTTQTIRNLFDEPRFNTASNSFSFLPMPDGSGVPNTMERSKQLFDKGHYWNTVRVKRPAVGNMAVGLNMTSGSLASNWLLFDNFRLFYGKDYTVDLDTLRSAPLPVYANVKSSRTLHAGGLNAVCLPYATALTDFDAVYEVAKADADGVTLIPAREMKVGHAYLVSVGADRTLEATDVLLSAVQPDSIPLLWNGVHYVGAPYARRAGAGAYRLNATGTALERVATNTLLEPCEPVFYLPPSLKNAPASLELQQADDLTNLHFAVNVENNQVHEYLAAASYPSPSTASIVEQYNKMDPARRDHPRNVLIPIPAQAKRPTIQRFYYSTQPDFADALRLNMPRGGTEFYLNNLIPGQTYYYKVETNNSVIAQGSVRAEGQLRMIYTSQGSNIRDMGGWLTESGHRTRYGRIFRGGEMHAGAQTTLTDDDVAELKRLGMGAEIDLRSDNEFSNGTVTYSALGRNVPYIYVNQVFGEPWGGDNPGDRATNLIDDTLKYRDAFNFLGEQCKAKRGTYFHCIWGADRTGAFGVLLNSLLGVSRSDICKDYELTTFSKAGLRKKVLIETKLAYLNSYPGKTLQERCYAYLSTYVKVDKSNLDAIIDFMVDDGSDGIEAVQQEPTRFQPQEDRIYDLQGRRIPRARLKHGLYIVNGRKVIL